ncbi:MAG TPA: group 1 truncated hemoglobin [Thiobacillaceae bacterium]|nr:group 1 truncated hemoglobin [Thiobacillaceae bacterium]HNA83338.1 group 1 truncated hemoglobin [Thiobacillaceae bacterium]HNF89829.1 group 1 truncated hemoglobin [Thiobacillaceae bacterium]HNH89942.1 group 1 truncated hemoglobin [Thiobacillaceae bacterium]HNI07232.1 group 1 truncated hemoglobin [Thiobacillaceae bacterium]
MNAPTETALETATLYDRLGGRPGIEAIVADIWNNHVSNPLIAKRYANSDPANVKRLVTEMCCAGFGGPETYTGKDMIAAHKGMNINDTEFVAVCDDVLKALDKNNVGKRERDEILCILYSLKGEVVYQ